MASNYNYRDLDLIPDLTFSFVEQYIKENKKSSGEKAVNKGFKYFSEGYIHDIKVEQDQLASIVKGKCFRSQRRNETPHSIKVIFDRVPTITKAECSCPIGLSEACGHISGLLYQIAKYKILKLKAVPEDVAKTSQPQTWHEPRGEKIKGKQVQNLEVSGYKKTDGKLETAPRTVKSTLYNPVRGNPVDWKGKLELLAESCPDMLVLPALENYDIPVVNTKFGSEDVINILNKLPVELLSCVCHDVLLFLQFKIVALDTKHLIEKFNQSNVCMEDRDLQSIINLLKHIYRSADKHKLDHDTLKSQLSSSLQLTDSCTECIANNWKIAREELTKTEDFPMFDVGKLVDMQWKLGVAVSSDTCKNLNSTFISMSLKVADTAGKLTTHSFEMTVPQFKNLSKQLQEMGRSMEMI